MRCELPKFLFSCSVWLCLFYFHLFRFTRHTLERNQHRRTRCSLYYRASRDEGSGGDLPRQITCHAKQAKMSLQGSTKRTTLCEMAHYEQHFFLERETNSSSGSVSHFLVTVVCLGLLRGRDSKIGSVALPLFFSFLTKQISMAWCRVNIWSKTWEWRKRFFFLFATRGRESKGHVNRRWTFFVNSSSCSWTVGIDNVIQIL